MKDIMFKGKDVNIGIWVYGGYVNSNKQYIVSCAYCFDGNGANAMFIEVNPDTVCEFTGLVDKNGIDIFYGDIHEHNGNRFVVRHGQYIDSDTGLCAYGWYFQSIVGSYQIGFNGREGEYANIVGNIYDEGD